VLDGDIVLAGALMLMALGLILLRPILAARQDKNV